jgi:hypothetical protein
MGDSGMQVGCEIQETAMMPGLEFSQAVVSCRSTDWTVEETAVNNIDGDIETFFMFAKRYCLDFPGERKSKSRRKN